MRDYFLGGGTINRRVSHRAWISLSILVILTEAMYIRPSMLSGSDSLLGFDYSQLHMLRIAFARNALFGARHTLPTWYPRELLGAPFSANLQNFPWIPSRLVLLFFDPTLAYAAGVIIAAALAAIFTYLYCRRVGLSEISAVAAAWTFACAGFFATRVEAGQLALLEAYPSLPLLLWLADRAVSMEPGKNPARNLIALAVASACVAVAGHPQLPAYSLASALFYLLLRGRGWRRLTSIAAMALGLGTTLVAWWPMLLLIQRSTRLLHLAEPSNDIALPYGRLLALIWPGIHGWPESVSLSDQHLFHAYPNDAYFWDTASYIGLLPLLIILALFFHLLVKRRSPKWPWNFLAALGLGALIFALPLAQSLRQMVPGMFLRSPARLLYLSTFSAAVALGFGVHSFLQSTRFRLRVRQGLVTFCLIFHVLNLGAFLRLFIQTTPRRQLQRPPFEQILASEVKDARIAADWALTSLYIDRYDDVGIYDSILLANTYRAILGLSGSARGLNVQRLDGSELSLQSLQCAGVRFVVTSTERTDLELVSETDAAYLYRVPDPAPRAAFFGMSRTEFMPGRTILDAFVSHPRTDRLLLPKEAQTYVPGNGERSEVKYLRISSDEIRLDTASEESGFAQVLESYDPGWTADVDGRPAPVVVANGFGMAVPVRAGKHEIRLRYDTPGREVGWILTLLSAGLLAGVIWTAQRVSGRSRGPV